MKRTMIVTCFVLHAGCATADVAETVERCLNKNEVGAYCSGFRDGIRYLQTRRLASAGIIGHGYSPQGYWTGYSGGGAPGWTILDQAPDDSFWGQFLKDTNTEAEKQSRPELEWPGLGQVPMVRPGLNNDIVR